MSGDKIFIAVVCGPTASGKTDIGIQLAKRLDGEIISADSMQVYKGMDIASAKPSREEQQGVPHHLMDFLPLNRAFSVADYVPLAHGCIADIAERGKLPIIVGGTGLYISSLIRNITFDDTGADHDFRRQMQQLAAKEGNQALWERLNAVDPAAAARLHPNNQNRIIRALEVFHTGGDTISSAQEKSRRNETPYDPCMIMPDFPREQLYARINIRVDKMMERGLLEEAAEFFTHTDYATSAQAIGYKELKPYLDGEKSLEECVERLKQSTRNYAKRQLTWFGKEQALNRIPAGNEANNGEIYKIAENLVKNYSNLRKSVL